MRTTSKKLGVWVEKLKEKILKFYKFEGALNDFIVIDGRFNPLKDPSRLAMKMLDRHASVGGDTLLYLEESRVADIKMRVLEIDGSESAMCGNGARCIGLYFDRFFEKPEITIETLAGVKVVQKIKDNYFKVSMGKMQTLNDFVVSSKNKKMIKMELFGLKLYVVNSSEPHAVIVVKNIKRIPKKTALKIARHFEIFPKGINVDFIEIVDSSTIKMRTIERGVYEETLACGTGAVASSYVFHKIFNGQKNVLVKALGGDLQVEIKDEECFLSGEANYVFKGEIPIEE